MGSAGRVQARRGYMGSHHAEADVAIREIAAAYLSLSRRWRSGQGSLSSRELNHWGDLRRALERALGTVPPPSQAGRRSWIRVPTWLEVRFEAGPGMRMGVVREISDGGAFIATDWPLHPGTMVRVELPPVAAGTPKLLTGLVAWWRPIGGLEGPAGMGIRFEVLDPDESERLLDLVERALFARLGG